MMRNSIWYNQPSTSTNMASTSTAKMLAMYQKSDKPGSYSWASESSDDAGRAFRYNVLLLQKGIEKPKN